MDRVVAVGVDKREEIAAVAAEVGKLGADAKMSHLAVETAVDAAAAAVAQYASGDREENSVESATENFQQDLQASPVDLVHARAAVEIETVVVVAVVVVLENIQ